MGIIPRIFQLSAYDYPLPKGLIANYPTHERHGSRLMVLHRDTHKIEHYYFSTLPSLLGEGDLLVLNDTKVFPARFFGKKPTGGKVEVVLLSHPAEVQEGLASSYALCRSSKPVRVGQVLTIGDRLKIEFLDYSDRNIRKVLLHYHGDLDEVLERHGHVPLPPYIKRADERGDRERYQTVFARETGSVAAPTAGLHFSRTLLDEIRAKGIAIAYLTLHVGYGTFSPVVEEDIRKHKIHTEWISVPASTVEAVMEKKASGGRVICVGTTTVRSLEYVFRMKGDIRSYHGPCDLYIYPGFEFKATDALITNFHLPRSSLLILVAAFAGLDFVLAAYREAIDVGYRFYSYGDAMFIV